LNAAAGDYTAAAQQWAAVLPQLVALGRTQPGFSVAVARVDNLQQQLGQQLQVGGGVPPVLPPIIGPGPGLLTNGMFACGAGENGAPRVCLFNQVGGPPVHDFYAFDPNFRGGVRVAVADLTGDGIPDLVAAPGGPPPGGFPLPPLVRVFDGRTMRLVSEFLAYSRDWTGGVFVAAAGITPRGRAVVVTGTDVGAGPHVRAFDVVTGRELASFMAYDVNYRGGVRVALGDVDGDGTADIITSPGPQHVPQIRVFSGVNQRPVADFLAFDPTHQVGAWVASADVTRNGRSDILVGADVNGCGLVRVFDPLRGVKLGEVSPYPGKFRGGIRVAAFDVNRDGVPDVICSPGPHSPAPVRVFDGRSSKPLTEFLPFEANFAGGAFIAAR
jgi:hypothetical protein